MKYLLTYPEYVSASFRKIPEGEVFGQGSMRMQKVVVGFTLELEGEPAFGPALRLVTNTYGPEILNGLELLAEQEKEQEWIGQPKKKSVIEFRKAVEGIVGGRTFN